MNTENLDMASDCIEICSKKKLREVFYPEVGFLLQNLMEKMPSKIN